jgi:serine protease Do
MYGRALQTDAAISTANYGGPLVDIRGRVLGILVPMAPQSTSEVAGVEWYDSGIGFAVPLSAIESAIARMKKGQDQYTGLLGVSLAGRQPLTTAATLAAVRPDSPAGKAGLKKGDRIVDVDGRPIKVQTDLRLALGSHYAGDNVRVTAKRGEENIERSIALVGKLPPFRHAFLGILPMRPAVAPAATNANTNRQPPAPPGVPPSDTPKQDPESKQPAESKQATDEPADEKAETDAEKAVVIRYVYPGSPAAEAKLQPGDRIEEIGVTKIANIEAAIEQLNNVAPDDEVALAISRGEEHFNVKLKASRLPTAIPTELPSAYKREDGEPAQAAGETRDLKLAALPQQCKVYVPAAHASFRPHGVLLWLHAPGESKPDDVIGDWKSICDRDGLILVVPTAEDVKQWERTELEYLRRLVERVVRQYRPDPQRMVVFGQGGGGGMAYLAGLAGREVFTGLATTAAALPRQVKPPDSEPAQRLAIFAGLPKDPAVAAEINSGLQKFSEAGYPISTLAITENAGRLTEAEREQLARWIDTLDRF